MGLQPRLASVYPPRETEDWIRCPLYQKYKAMGIQARSIEYTPNVLLGTAIGDGLSAAYRVWNQPGIDREAVAFQAAQSVMERGYEENSKWTQEGLERLIHKGIKAGINEDVPRGGTIIRVDTSTGVARPDLVHRKVNGDLTVTDTKVTLELDGRWLPRRLLDYETAWQLWHYAWEVEQLMGEPVRWTQAHLIALTPKCLSVLIPIEVNPKRLHFWLSQAERVWADRKAEEDGLRPPVPNWLSCHGKYGQCEFYELDHVYHGDLGLAQMLYTRAVP